jgi:hypothetical protein
MSTITAFGVLLNKVGFRSGLCNQFLRAADELTHVAKDLKASLDTYKRASDPFGEMLSTMHNNREFEKSFIRDVDTATKAGVQASSITTAPGPAR